MWFGKKAIKDWDGALQTLCECFEMFRMLPATYLQEIFVVPSPSFFNSETLFEKRRIEPRPNVGVARNLSYLFRWLILK